MVVEPKRWFREIVLFGPLALAVRFLPDPAAGVPVHPHGTVTVIGMEGAARCVDRDVTMVHTQAVTLRIAIGEEAALQHFIW